MASPTRARVAFALTAAVGLTVDQLSKTLVESQAPRHAPIHRRRPAHHRCLPPYGGGFFLRARRARGIRAAGVGHFGGHRPHGLTAALDAVGVTFGLILAGAVGKLVDRLGRRPGLGCAAVVDFIDLKYFATFNIADSCITCGAVLAPLLTLRGGPLAPRRNSRCRSLNRNT